MVPQPQTFHTLLFSLFAWLLSLCSCHDGTKIQGMFVFGSSLVDNGNNNNLQDSIARADYLPYGIDFPDGPTGRFTNGKNLIDLLGDHLQLPAYIPPSTHPSTTGPNIVHGVNYASGGSGILDDTGAVLVPIFPILLHFYSFLHHKQI